MNVDDLKKSLEPAIRQIHVLCQGFSARMDPSYSEIVHKVCENIARKKNLEQSPVLVYMPRVGHSFGASQTKTKLQQFKEKFIEISKKETIPHLRKFCAKNQGIRLNDFRPLFDIRIAWDG